MRTRERADQAPDASLEGALRPSNKKCSSSLRQNLRQADQSDILSN